MANPAGYFVWVRGLRGVVPQRWAQLATIDGKPVPYLQIHPLNEKEMVIPTLYTLATRYPYTGPDYYATHRDPSTAVDLNTKG